MKIYLSSIVVFMILFGSCRQPSIRHIQTMVDSIGQVWVPDDRLGINQVKIGRIGSSYLLKGEVNHGEHKAELLSFFHQHNLLFVDSLVVLPNTETDYQGLVCLSIANMRQSASHSSELVSQALMGTPVVVFKQEGGWLLIQTPDGYIAWVTDDSVSMLPSGHMADWRSSNRLMVMAQHAYVYRDIRESGIVCDLVLGGLVQRGEIEGSYYHVSLPDGREGVIRIGDVVRFEEWLADTHPTSASVVQCARSFMGLPYLWGGTSANGLDCSGFVKTVYFMNGTILRRDASQQFQCGTVVVYQHFGDFKAGDLLFFGNRKGNRVTHVGISLGDGEFIHESGMVRINSLDSTQANYSRYYSHALLGALRVIGVPSREGHLAVADHSWYVNLITNK